jgi:hypothetical protein
MSTAVQKTVKEHLYTRDRILTVFSRVRKAGGIRLDEKVMQHTASWFRTLALRGFADAALLSDATAAKNAFKGSFPNTTTRCQYARAIVTYLGGLTDEDFAAEYPGATREEIVKLMKDIVVEAGKEKRAQ